jgi:hypothetical protein
MEVAGVLPPPPEKKGYGSAAKAARTKVTEDKEESEDLDAGDDSDIPLLLEDDENEGEIEEIPDEVPHRDGPLKDLPKIESLE